MKLRSVTESWRGAMMMESSPNGSVSRSTVQVAPRALVKASDGSNVARTSRSHGWPNSSGRSVWPDMCCKSCLLSRGPKGGAKSMSVGKMVKEGLTHCRRKQFDFNMLMGWPDEMSHPVATVHFV